METPSQEQQDQWHNDPKNWKWGFFYCNPEDKRLFVDKRNPNFGATVNFAHPKSYLFIIGIVAFIVLVLFTVHLSNAN